MSLFNFLRRPAAPSPAAASHGKPTTDLVVEVKQRAVASGLTVELKLRGRKGGGQEPGLDPGLEAAENRLAQLQTIYRLGQYSGHPEEMLEDIEFAENTLRRLRSGPSS